MYAEILTALATALEGVTGKRPVKGVPLFGAQPLATPSAAVLCETLPEAPTRNGAKSGAGSLSFTVAVFGGDEAEGLKLAEAVVAWLEGAPTLEVAGRRVNVKRNGTGERIPNEQQTAELAHAFSVPLLINW